MVISHLKIFIDTDDNDLINLYKSAVKKHNDEIKNNPYPNSGFDIFIPEEQTTNENNKYWIDHKIKATMTELVLFPKMDLATGSLNGHEWKRVGCGFSIYPRSSLSKTPLMLANHVGIIDSGYSGNLIGAFFHVSNNPVSFKIEKASRLLQVCHPSLVPFTVEIVDKQEELFENSHNTKRGNGGFGSTGV